jgi:hypothetical protein
MCRGVPEDQAARLAQLPDFESGTLTVFVHDGSTDSLAFAAHTQVTTLVSGSDCSVTHAWPLPRHSYR